jgi:hypothetical protein
MITRDKKKELHSMFMYTSLTALQQMPGIRDLIIRSPFQDSLEQSRLRVPNTQQTFYTKVPIGLMVHHPDFLATGTVDE